MTLLLAALLLGANAFFVASEFALVASRRTRLAQAAADGDASASVALAAIERLGMLLAGAQLGVTLASLALGAVAEPAAASVLEPALEWASLPAGAVHPVALAVALAIVVALHMLVGEMVPKTLAISEPERSARALARPMLAFVRTLGPAIRLLNSLANGGVRLLGVAPQDTLSDAVGPEDLSRIVAASRREGAVEEDDARLLASVLRFRRITVGSVMVPRSQVVAVPADASVADIERLVVETGHSRFPVYGSDLDDIKGFVHAKSLLPLPSWASNRPVPSRLVRQMLVAPRNRRAGELLLQMQRIGIHFAQVVDQTGRTAGIATMEDLLEQLVGQIRDEFDPAPAL